MNNPVSDANLPRAKIGGIGPTRVSSWVETPRARKERHAREDAEYAEKCGPVTVRMKEDTDA